MKTIRINRGHLAKLRFVKAVDCLGRRVIFPDFFIAGPQRTGTTWLGKQVSLHPQIYLTPRKEVYFFNLLLLPNHPLFFSRRLSIYSHIIRPHFLSSLKATISNIGKFGCPSRFKLICDATASYAAMERAFVQEAKVLNPNLKVVIGIRNPIERAWSHAKKDVLKGRHPETIDFDEFRVFYNGTYQRRCGSYSEIIPMWEEELGPDKVFVYLFEKIADNPKDLVKDLFKFLEVDTSMRIIAYLPLAMKFGKGPPLDIPMEHYDFLLKIYHKELVYLKKQFHASYQI